METAPPIVEEAPPTASLWEDFIDIFIAPAQVFARREDGRFGIALVVLTLASALVAFGIQMALGDALLADMRRAMENAGGNAQISEENLAQMRTFGAIGAVVSGLIGVPLTVFVAAIVVWLLGTFVNAKGGYKVVVMIVTYANFPRVLDGFSRIVQGLIFNPDSIYGSSLGLSRFVPREGMNPLLLALMDRVDLFTLWVALLVGIGLHVAGRVPKGAAYAVAAAFWLLGVLPALIPAAMGGFGG
jgi:hypothetical protein